MLVAKNQFARFVDFVVKRNLKSGFGLRIKMLRLAQHDRTLILN